MAIEFDYTELNPGMTNYVDVHNSNLAAIDSAFGQVPRPTYEMVVFRPGLSAINTEIIFSMEYRSPDPVTFPLDFIGDNSTLLCKMSSLTAFAADSNYTLRKNGVTWATYTFFAGTTLGVLQGTAPETVLNQGDIFNLVGPATFDATGGGIRFALIGYK